jgi:hypothetical protein
MAQLYIGVFTGFQLPDTNSDKNQKERLYNTLLDPEELLRMKLGTLRTLLERPGGHQITVSFVITLEDIAWKIPMSTSK